MRQDFRQRERIVRSPLSRAKNLLLRLTRVAHPVETEPARYAKHGELLTQGENFQGSVLPTAQEDSDSGQGSKEEFEHGTLRSIWHAQNRRPPRSSEGPSPEGDGFGRHKHAQSAEADFRSRPDRRLSAAVLRRFRSLRDLLKASPKGEGFHPSPMGTLST